ncbi:MAG: GNAT family N-acetyltransferase [Caldilineaceae bacterium]|nr:GNAT family N-acetyltransferase [Caldilineaceae bacterium]
MNEMVTPRLLLREFRESDYEAILAQVYTDRAVWGMYSSIGNKPAEIRRRFLNRCYQPSNAEFGFRAVEVKATGQVIGQVHLEPRVIDRQSIPNERPSPFSIIEVELAFAFGKAYWGQGYAYEACQAMIDYAFRQLRLPRLVGGALAANDRSIKLHQRLGYQITPDPIDPAFVIAVLDNQRLSSQGDAGDGP